MLNNNIKTDELVYTNMFKVVHRDRHGLLSGKSDGGGVLIAVNNRYTAVHYENSLNLTLMQTKINIFVVYSPTHAGD